MAKRPDEEVHISSTPRQAVVFYPYVDHYDGITKNNVMDTRRIEATSSVYDINYQNAKTGLFTDEVTLGPVLAF